MPAEFHQACLPAPMMEPLTAYRRLSGHRPLLLDGMGAHPDSRYAYLALGAAFELRHQDGHWSWDRDDPPPGPGLAGLQEVLDAYRFDAGPGFTGGFVGYFGYEATALVEPTLRMHQADTPDIVLRLCRDVLQIDRVDQTAKLWVADLPGEDGAEERAQAYLHALTLPESPRPSPMPAPGGWQASMDARSFQDAVRRLRRHVAEGDHFQANLATRFSAPVDTPPEVLFERLAARNPSPYMALMDLGDHAIVSCSPELLFRLDGGTIRTRPIAGTRKRGKDAADVAMEQELLTDDKEQAEHTMLVDLLRNDIAKVSVPGTVHVPEFGSIERYSHVMHLVSRVEGTIRADATVTDCIAALFPGGTVTGAPKHRACMRIHEHEPVARGPYTGSAGYIGWDHSACFNILIRTIVLKDSEARIHAGSGIVMDSDPVREWQEAGHKARALLAAADEETAVADRLGEVTQHRQWQPAPATTHVDARVLIIDNYDSFTYNLADMCASLGAQVRVVRNDADWEAVADELRPTHFILGPGPGRPEDSRATLEVLAGASAPTLGVCLGHQAMGVATGAQVIVLPAVHGKTDEVRVHANGLLTGDRLRATRYHSLAVDSASLSAEWEVTATSGDGTVMAMRHRHRPWHGLQFHPESLCTDGGLEIIRRFLES